MGGVGSDRSRSLPPAPRASAARRPFGRNDQEGREEVPLLPAPWGHRDAGCPRRRWPPGYAAAAHGHLSLPAHRHLLLPPRGVCMLGARAAGLGWQRRSTAAGHARFARPSRKSHSRLSPNRVLLSLQAPRGAGVVDVRAVPVQVVPAVPPGALAAAQPEGRRAGGRGGGAGGAEQPAQVARHGRNHAGLHPWRLLEGDGGGSRWQAERRAATAAAGGPAGRVRR